ncbi:MAG: class I SAM-dependent methyltransferase [Micropruina sp.]|uniref:class I SAM-dependent methyltransferase n=1 Tax=Micropruina sp. TaxID=2737536 RepID=UPI0039E5E701
MTDHYHELGELHDLFMPGAWDALVGPLATTFGHLGADATIVDLGAGSGLGTVRLARATRARIVAIEPSLTMRSMLLARVSDDPELSERVSVYAGAAPAILDQIDGPVDGFLCAHMLGHLSVGERRATFQRLSALLATNGVGLITVSPQSAPETEVVEERRIGRHRYIERQLPTDLAGTSVSEYQVFDGNRLLRSATFTSSWAMPSPDELRDELHAAGLTLGPSDRGLAPVRHASVRHASVAVASAVPGLDQLRAALPFVPRDEVLAHAGSARHNGPAAEEATRSATYPTRLALHTLACVEPLRACAVRAGVDGARVLDLGCGPAMVSRVLLAAGARRVDAVDASPAMIAAALALPTHPGLTLTATDATGPLPFPDAAFDVVWVGDFWRDEILPEIRRVLRPDGRLVLRATTGVDWLPPDVDPGFAERVRVATLAGLDGWVASRGGPGFVAPPTGDVPGWSDQDAWQETVEFHCPVPEVVEEYLLQDFASFHGNLAAPELSVQDWHRLCTLVDPTSPQRALAQPGGRLVWTSSYRVLRPAIR